MWERKRKREGERWERGREVGGREGGREGGERESERKRGFFLHCIIPHRTIKLQLLHSLW